MKTTVRYIAIGLARVRIGKLWKTIRLPRFKINDKGKLLSAVADTIYHDVENDDVLHTKGVVLQIEKETRVEDEDEVFINKEYEFESVGNLNDAEYFEMQDELLNKTKWQ